MLKGKGILMNESPERHSYVIDAPKRLVIPRGVASPQSQTLFHQPTPEYTSCSTKSTFHRTLKPLPQKSNVPVRLQKIKIAKIEFENLFSNLSLTYFKTVADSFL
jgi:hypothetical protein